MVFKTENNQTLAFDRKAVEEEQTELLKIYRITEDMSSDLQVASSRNESETGKTARVHRSNASTSR